MTRPASQAEIADHNYDLIKHDLRPADRQRYAVAALIGECESIAASGCLTEPAEQSLRVLIAQTLVVFDMQFRDWSKSERAKEAV